jgi:hypothetical protein
MTPTPLKPFTTPKGVPLSKYKEIVMMRPKEILTQNSKMKKSGYYNFDLPGFKGAYVENGIVRDVQTCPQAGKCVQFCFACQGGYNFNSAMTRHNKNLQWVMDDPTGFSDALVKEVLAKRNCKVIRCHTSGDFYNMDYFMMWRDIMLRLPHVKFYAYTKQVSLMKNAKAMGLIPANFTYVFSYGGKQDHLIDRRVDRHARIFVDQTKLANSRYSSAVETDAPAANPNIRRIGLVFHGSPWLKKRNSKTRLF